MLDRIKKLIASVPEDGAIYLAEKLSQHSGFFITNGHLLYLVVNIEGISHTSLATDYLLLNTNVDIQSFANNQKFPSGKYNVLEFLPTEQGYEENKLESFLNLCISHTEHMDGRSFVKFFFSLSELFQDPKDQQFKNLIGFFGELSFLKCMSLDYHLDLSACWHKGGSRDKYEIVLNDSNIEIKTTAAVDEQITIKHTQLFNSDQNYLAVVCVEESSSGQKLNQLIGSMLQEPKRFNNYNFVLNLEREKGRISPVDANSKKLSVKYVKLYDAASINPFNEIPECVSQLTYKLDLVDKVCIPEDQWESLFNNE